MNNFELEVDESVEVIVGDKTYKSLIIDFTKNHDNIKINVPVYKGEYLFKELEDELHINVYSKSGRCYSFNSKIIRKGIKNSIPYYNLSSPYNIKRIQRRNYFRVDILKDIKYKNITGISDEKEIKNIMFDNALMVDLSGGGMRLILKGEVKLNDILLIRIEIKNSEMLLKGQVIRVGRNNTENKICGIKFLDITEIQVDKIIEELFEIMRKQKALL